MGIEVPTSIHELLVPTLYSVLHYGYSFTEFFYAFSIIDLRLAQSIGADTAS